MGPHCRHLMNAECRLPLDRAQCAPSRLLPGAWVASTRRSWLNRGAYDDPPYSTDKNEVPPSWESFRSVTYKDWILRTGYYSLDKIT